MPRIPGLAKDIADMALLLMREGTDPAIALNSASRLSDATPKQVEFADDLLKRMDKASGKRVRNIDGDINVPVAVRTEGRPNPNAPLSNQLLRINKSMPPMSNVNRLDRSIKLNLTANAVADQAATNRLYQELAYAASSNNPELMQTILVELGYLPDNAYNVASRYFA